MFNRREQLALLFLTGALLVGSGLALVDYFRPSSLEEFQVISGAVEPPRPPQQVADIREAGPLHLNEATALQLQRLPSIGPKMAERILQYRATHGPFQTLEDLQQVRGIGVHTIEKLRPLVVVGQNP